MGSLSCASGQTKWILLCHDVETAVEASSFTSVSWILMNPYLLPVRLPHKDATCSQLPYHNIDMNQIQNRAKDLSQGEPTSQLSGLWYNFSDLAHHHLSIKYHLNLSIDVSLCQTKWCCLLYQKLWVDLTGPFQCNFLWYFPSLYRNKQVEWDKSPCNVSSWTSL